MKAYWRSGGIAVRFRSVALGGGESLNPQGKSLSYPLDRRLGRPRSPSGHGAEEKSCQHQTYMSNFQL
jgi:hypothetical protein